MTSSSWESSIGILTLRSVISALFPFVVVLIVTVTNHDNARAEETKENVTDVDSDEDIDSSEANFLIRGRVTDDEGYSVVGATIKTMMGSERDEVMTKSRQNGAFVLKVPAAGHYGPSLLITDATGKLASYISGFDYDTSSRKLFNVTVKPCSTTVTVQNESGSPVPDAMVVLQATLLDLVRAATDANGKAVLRFPADAKVDWINAFKDGVGYDYYENYDTYPSQERLEVPDAMTLTLKGSVSVTVTVLDDTNQPVKDARVSPWTIKLKDKLASANVCATLVSKTDAEGKVVFGWIPKNLAHGCTMLAYHKDFHCPKTPVYRHGEYRELTAKVFRNAIVSGKVTFADGTPADRIRLQGEGRGGSNHYFRGHTTTGPDGSYEIQIYPNQVTILAVTDREYAAKSATGIQLKPGMKAKADFMLTAGTLIHGVMTIGEKQEPMQGETATLIQKAAGIGGLVRWSETDPEGYYFFRVGQGKYSLTLPGKDDITVVVKGESEIVHDAHIARRPRGQFQGQLVDTDGDAIVGAEVHGGPIDDESLHSGFKTRTDSEGRFATERWLDDMFIYAVDRKKRLAGFSNIAAAENDVMLTLKPAAMIHGRAADETGKPLAGNRVQLSFAPIVGSGWVYFFTHTDDDGKFAFPAATGVTCKACVQFGDQFTDSSDLVIDQAKQYELKPFKVQREQER